MTDMDPTTRESILRAALARIAGLTGDDAQRSTVGVLASILSEVNETAERALGETGDRAKGA